MPKTAQKQQSKGLGKGLSALLSQDVPSYSSLDNIADVGSTIQQLPLEVLQPGAYQPRTVFTESALNELAQSIKQHGILQPLLVRALEKKQGQYEIIAGERRWQAAKIAGLKTVPVLVQDLTDSQALEIGLVENVQRQDLTPIEEALGYRRLIEEFQYSKETLTTLVGRSLSHVTNTIRLLSLPEEVRDMVDNQELSAGHARALITLEDPVPLAKQIVAQGLNVRQIEDIVKRQKPGRLQTGQKVTPLWVEQLRPLEQNFTRLTGLPATIKQVGNGGKITLAFSSKHDLEMLLLKFQDK